MTTAAATTAAAKALIESHLELSRKAATMLYPRVREHIEFDELVALGNAGLAEAAHRYDPSAGASFATFAWYRVYGAIVDGLRKMTSLPRRTWTNLLALRAASEYLEACATRTAAANKASAAPTTTGKTLDELRSAIASIQTIYFTSLEAHRAKGHDIADAPHDPGAHIDSERRRAKLRAAMAQLPDKERALMEKHYLEGKNLLEAGQELGISKSWASRMHANAVERLRQLILGDAEQAASQTTEQPTTG